jgi:phage FluMu protein Com
MESVHELAARPSERSRSHLEFFQTAEVTTIRCPCCNGLRTAARDRRTKSMCPECRKGNIVPRTQFHNYWLTRFSLDEIIEMGRAIWG